MKKIFTMAAVLLMTVGGVMAQNTFKGVVKYKVESTGSVAVDLPEEVRSAVRAMRDRYTEQMAGLAVYVRRIRKKIEDNPAEPQFLLTVWGEGYTFKTGD